MLRLLTITAHPDDESAAFGGSMLLARERGIETFVLCLTAGDAATHRGGAETPEALAAMRRLEFASACEHLNVSKATILNYADGRLDRVNFYECVAELVRIVREIRPQVVLTFAPEGGVTAHPDHSMAALLTTAAVHWAGRTNRYADQFYAGGEAYRPQKLYYATNDFTLEDRQPIVPCPVTTVIEIGEERLARKIAAFRKHTSQSPLFELFESHVRPRGTKELFHLAARSQPSMIERIETDLWEGVEDLP